MKRTKATLEALHRDKWVCQRHLHCYGVAFQATDGHHLFGRQNDVPQAIIALCHACHMQLHQGMFDNSVLVKIQVKRGHLTEDGVTELESEKVRGGVSAKD